MASKMRMVYPLPGKRNPQNEDRVTFKKSKEFKLKDYVRETVTNKATPCIFEITLLLSCLKESSFNDSMCTDEVKNFQNCYVNAMNSMEALKQRKLKGVRTSDHKMMISKEINEMFKVYK